MTPFLGKERGSDLERRGEHPLAESGPCSTGAAGVAPSFFAFSRTFPFGSGLLVSTPRCCRQTLELRGEHEGEHQGERGFSILFTLAFTLPPYKTGEMMPIIKRQNKDTFTVMNIRLETGLSDKLKDYAKFLETTPSDIVSQALGYAIKRDKEFGKTKATDPARENKEKTTVVLR